MFSVSCSVSDGLLHRITDLQPFANGAICRPRFTRAQILLISQFNENLHQLSSSLQMAVKSCAWLGAFLVINFIFWNISHIIQQLKNLNKVVILDSQH
jgi:hypothetical protein